MFFVIEGIEGAGKSTIIKVVAQKLKQHNKSTFITSEPTGNGISFGQDIRKIIMENDINPLTEFLLFSSFRSEHVSKFISKWIIENDVVICDRFILSSIIYQGKTLGVDLNLIEQINQEVLGKLKIDLTFLIDLDPKIAKQRINKRNGNITDKFDNMEIDFHNNIRKYYLDYAKEHERKFLVINGEKDIEEISTEIVEKILSII